MSARSCLWPIPIPFIVLRAASAFPKLLNSWESFFPYAACTLDISTLSNLVAN